MIQWYYWGDKISDSCVVNEDPSKCGGRTQSEWKKLAKELATEIDDKMKGKQSVVIIETEFHKTSIDNHDQLDKLLAEQMDFFHAKAGIKTALGFGHWCIKSDGTGSSDCAQYKTRWRSPTTSER